MNSVSRYTISVALSALCSCIWATTSGSTPLLGNAKKNPVTHLVARHSTPPSREITSGRISGGTVSENSSAGSLGSRLISLRALSKNDPKSAIDILLTSSRSMRGHGPAAKEDLMELKLLQTAFLEGLVLSGTKPDTFISSIEDQATRNELISQWGAGGGDEFNLCIQAQYNPQSIEGDNVSPRVALEWAVFQFEKHPEKTIRMLQSNIELLPMFVSKLGPSAALERMLEELPPELKKSLQGQVDGLSAILGTYTVKETTENISLNRELAIHSSIVSSNAELTFEALKRLEPGDDFSNASSLMRGLDDPDFIVGLLSRIAETTDKNILLKNFGQPLTEAMARSAPPISNEFLAKLTNEAQSQYSIELAHHDPTAALDWAQKLPAEFSDLKNVILATAAKEDFGLIPNAIDTLNKSPNSESINLAGAIAGALSNSGEPPQTILGILDGIFDAEVRNSILAELTTAVSKEDPVAASFIAARMERGTNYDEAVLSLVSNMIDDSERQSIWIQSIGDPVKRAQAQKFVKSPENK